MPGAVVKWLGASWLLLAGASIAPAKADDAARQRAELFDLYHSVLVPAAHFSTGELCAWFGAEFLMAQRAMAELVARAGPDLEGVLEIAVASNSLADARRLYEAGAEPVAITNSLLHVAVVYAGPDMLEFLVSIGLDVNSGMTAGQPTPLHAAVEANRIENIQWLIDNGADVNARWGNSPPINYVVVCRDQGTLDLLVANGADVSDAFRHRATRAGLKVRR